MVNPPTLVNVILGLSSLTFLALFLISKRKATLSKTTPEEPCDESVMAQYRCFQSPHEAIALFNEDGRLIIANALFDSYFPLNEDLDRRARIHDFFPEKMRDMLGESLDKCYKAKKDVEREFSIEDKPYIFTFCPAHNKNQRQDHIFLFCKELFRPSQPKHLTSPDDIIWRSILKLSNPDALHSDWYSCFQHVVPDMCSALEGDELFLLDSRAASGTPLTPNTAEAASAYNHDWILSVPVWMNLLGKGQILHNFSDNFDLEEQIILEQEGTQALLLIPLIVEKELVGILGITKTQTRGLFHQQQINSFIFVSNILTMAIGNQQDRLERDRLVTVVEQSSDCIIIINTSGTVLYANPACELVTGFSPVEIVGRSIKRIHTPAIRKKLWNTLKGALVDGKSWSGQFDNYRKDNSLYQEEMSISPVYDHDGRVANQVIVKRDITEDKRLESIAEAANLMDNIGFIFSSIRHELGNPINSIKVSLSVLESNLESYDTTAITRFIHRSLSDIGRIEYLLKTLRNFSIFERPDIQETDMKSLLDKLTQLTEKDLAQRYVMLAINHPREPLTGLIDPRAFLQVLLNLTTNAVSALSDCENKKITISLIRKQENQISFIFEDNGCGMDDETIRNLFRPFFTTKAEGTGLGLVIVKKMLSKMNCSITASSTRGKGTRMEIIIPAG